MRFIGALILWIIIFFVAGAIWIWSGTYDIGADAPHWRGTRYVIGQLREHSIEARLDDIDVPDLDDPALIAEGAEHYGAMCTGCHLAPGKSESELRVGLYPRPPNLSRFAPDPAEAFWVIKHGIKMTGMPAWGKTHDDEKIWALVAYLQKQPHMSVARYRQLTAGAEAMEAHEHEHEHVGAMPGMAMPDADVTVPASGVSGAMLAPAHSSLMPAPAASR